MISIVMAYYNRFEQLKHTINTIKKSEKYNECEIILVSDHSPDEEELFKLTSEYPPLKIIKMKDYEEKWYHNPCIVYNTGFYEAKGDVIIIQNPECCHMGDIISYAATIKNDEYYSFACLSLNEENSKKLRNGEAFSIENRSVSFDGDNGWYNHSTLRPVGYHFCSAITRENLKKLNGFDERFAQGHGYDDNELLMRIRRLNLKIKFIDSPSVIHQHHYSGTIDTTRAIKNNNQLLHEISRESIIRSPNNKREI